MRYANARGNHRSPHARFSAWSDVVSLGCADRGYFCSFVRSVRYRVTGVEHSRRVWRFRCLCRGVTSRLTRRPVTWMSESVGRFRMRRRGRGGASHDRLVLGGSADLVAAALLLAWLALVAVLSPFAEVRMPATPTQISSTSRSGWSQHRAAPGAVGTSVPTADSPVPALVGHLTRALVSRHHPPREAGHLIPQQRASDRPAGRSSPCGTSSPVSPVRARPGHAVAVTAAAADRCAARGVDHAVAARRGDHPGLLNR